jgi:hypothetical protein
MPRKCTYRSGHLAVLQSTVRVPITVLQRFNSAFTDSLPHMIMTLPPSVTLPPSATLPSAPISHTAITMAEIDVWFIFFDHDKPLLQFFLESLHPQDTIMHLMRKIKAGDYEGPIANAKITDLEVWKFRSLKLNPRDKQMGELLSNLKLTDSEDSDVELVNVQTMMEELHLKRFEPLLVRVLQKGMQSLSSASCSLLSSPMS